MAPSQKGTHHPRVCWIKVSYITATINETRTLSQPRTAQPNRTTLTFTRGTNERTNREQVKEKLSIQFNSIQFKSRTSQKLAVCVDQDPAHLFLSLCPGFNKMPFITSIETPAASSKRHAHVMSEALPARKATAGKVKDRVVTCVSASASAYLPTFLASQNVALQFIKVCRVSRSPNLGLAGSAGGDSGREVDIPHCVR